MVASLPAHFVPLASARGGGNRAVKRNDWIAYVSCLLRGAHDTLLVS